jgi:hypothetical protein
MIKKSRRNIEYEIAKREFLLEGEPKTNLKVKLIGENGNIFNLIAITSEELRKEGYFRYSDELKVKVFDCKSYEESLRLIMEYVEVI